MRSWEGPCLLHFWMFPRLLQSFQTHPRPSITAVSPTDGKLEAALVLCPLEGKEKAGPESNKMNRFPYRVSLTLIKAACRTIILSSYYFHVFHAGYKCQNTLSVRISMGFIATEGTHVATSGKGSLVLSGLPSPTLCKVPQ